jgi:hypothetical protein
LSQHVLQAAVLPRELQDPLLLPEPPDPELAPLALPELPDPAVVPLVVPEPPDPAVVPLVLPEPPDPELLPVPVDPELLPLLLPVLSPLPASCGEPEPPGEGLEELEPHCKATAGTLARKRSETTRVSKPRFERDIREAMTRGRRPRQGRGPRQDASGLKVWPAKRPDLSCVL